MLKDHRPIVSVALATSLTLATSAAPPKDGLYLPLGADIITAPWAPNTKLIDDYAQTTYGDRWDFDDGTAERIAEFGKGIVDRRVVDGRLKFRTGDKDAWFYWGDADGKFSKHRQEKFRWNHPYWSVGVLRLRMRQSAQESQWEVNWGRWTELSRPKPRQGTSRRFTLRGTEWQTVEVKMGRRGEHFASWLAIETQTPGNAVEIDEVRLVRTSERACFRTEIHVPSRPSFAGIWYVAQPQYDIHINGRKVHTWDGNGCGWWPAWLDITEYVTQGANCIAFDRELLDWMGRMNFLIVGGVVRCADGQIVRIATGPEWRLSKTPAAGWTRAGFDDSGWEKTRSLGEASSARFPKGVTGLDEMWREALAMGYQVIPPQHLGALELSCPDRPDPLFLVGEPVQIVATAPCRRFDGRRYGLSYRLRDSTSREIVGRGALAELQDDDRHQRWELKKAGLMQGVYALYLHLTVGDHTEETAFLELAVCGPVGGKKVRGVAIEEGLDLKLVDTIRCGDANDPHERVLSPYRAPRPRLPQPKLIDHPVAGSALELARGWQWAGYRIRFDDTTRPYLVRVNYPDVHPQVIGVRIDSPFKGRGRYNCIAASGAYTCRETPPSSEMRSFSMLAWPRHEDATLCLVNYNGPNPALVKSVEILRIDNELPQLDIPNAHPCRTFGYATERGTTMLSTFFQSKVGWRFTHHMENCSTTATLHHWWIAAERLIRWLKFTGQNAWCFNAHMYQQTYYPTTLSHRFEKSAFQNHLPLLAKMFEANDLHLFAGSEFMSARPIWKRDIYTDDEVAEGADTIKAVSHEGRQQLHFAGAGSNYQHPVVEEAIVQMVRDLCEPMAAYPAFKGIHFMCGGYFAPSVFKLHRQFDLLKCSYDDTSIRRFERFAGVKLPEFGRTREKFARRRQWIEENAKDKWIAWRCAAVTDLVRRCAAAAASVRAETKGTVLHGLSPTAGDQRAQEHERGQSLKDSPRAARGNDMTLVFNWGDWSYGQARTKGWADGQAYADVAAELGVDYQALGRIPGTVHGEKFEQLGEFVHSRDAIAGAFNAAQQCSEIRANFAPGSHSAYLHHPFMEGGLSIHPAEGWPWTAIPSCTWSPRPVGADYVANFTRTLSGGVPAYLWHGYCDCEHYGGGEQAIRSVAHNFRTIPPGAYGATDRIRTRNVVLRVSRDGGSFLLINPAWWPLDCELTLDGETAAVTHMATGSTHRGPAVSIPVGPFGVESFRLKGGARLVRVTGSAPGKRARDEAEAALAEIESFQGRAGLQGISEDEPGAKAVARIAGRLRSHVAARDWGGVYHLTKSIEYCRAADWAKKTAMCTALLVIGPFDNPQREFFTKPTPVEIDILGGKAPAGEYVGKSGAEISWQRAWTRVVGGVAGYLDFIELCGPVEEAVAYALVYAHSQTDQTITLRLGSDDSIRAWVNGRLVASDFADRSAQPGQVVRHCKLRKGSNVLLFKIDQNVGAWAAYIEIMGRRGEALANVRVSCSP